MTPSKPYLIRAIYDWIVDNGLTPYLVVDAKQEFVQVPQEFVEDGRIILNVSPVACRGLHLENDRIVFSARFAGEVKQIFSPPKAVLAIYARENGQGMVFTEEHDGTGGDGSGGGLPPSAPPTSTSQTPAASKSKRANLRVIK
jgi:stringent starvation protein B